MGIEQIVQTYPENNQSEAVKALKAEVQFLRSHRPIARKLAATESELAAMKQQLAAAREALQVAEAILDRAYSESRKVWSDELIDDYDAFGSELKPVAKLAICTYPKCKCDDAYKCQAEATNATLQRDRQP